jgi:hypothetical protein
VHTDRRRGEGVVRWEDQCAPVLSVIVGCLLWAGDYVVPSAPC